jgi:hypothetical protein
MPLALTDSEMQIVLSIGSPIDPSARSAYLEDVAKELNGLVEIGDGAIARIAREVQRRYWTPPDLSASRWVWGGPWCRLWEPGCTALEPAPPSAPWP